MVQAMPPGSVTCDLAASNGGNVSVTKKGETYLYNDKVTVIGHENWPAQMGNIASAMWGGNVTKLLVPPPPPPPHPPRARARALRPRWV